MNIILAHGILGFDNIGKLGYFNGLQNYLRDNYNDVKVLVTSVDPTGSIPERGRQLGKEILAALGHNGQRPSLDPDSTTHIIAHSMGGLDSRYILSPDNGDDIDIAPFITSLTTIGTPHRGSPIADLLYSPLDGEAAFHAAVQNILALARLSLDGLQNLTTEAMEDFNGTYGDHDGVRYFWAAGIGRSEGRVASWPFLPLHKYIQHKGQSDEEKTSDGVVPLSSARREAKGWEPSGGLWEADHANEVGHNLDDYLTPEGAFTAVRTALGYESDQGIPSDYILSKYDEIIARIKTL
ncbi:MAG: hypothetical protein ACXWTP_00265 [Methylosarcina sp.]